MGPADGTREESRHSDNIWNGLWVSNLHYFYSENIHFYGLQNLSQQSLSLTTFLGCSICIVTAIRIQQIEDMDISNPTKSFAVVGLCAILEPLLGIVNACLPFIGPVLHMMTPRIHDLIRRTFHNSALQNRGRLGKGTNGGRHSATYWWKNKHEKSTSTQRKAGDNDTLPQWRIENRIGRGDKVYDVKGPATGPEFGIRVHQEWLVHEEGAENS